MLNTINININRNPLSFSKQIAPRCWTGWRHQEVVTREAGGVLHKPMLILSRVSIFEGLSVFTVQSSWGIRY